MTTSHLRRHATPRSCYWSTRYQVRRLRPSGGLLSIALYALVSTSDQHPEIRLHALRQYAAARGVEAEECVDAGVSGAKDRRAALDRLLADARRRKVSAVVVAKLDRLGRSVRHLTTLAAELAAPGVDLVVLDQSIDTGTPSGRLLFHVLGSIAEFARDRPEAAGRRGGRKGVRSRRQNPCNGGGRFASLSPGRKGPVSARACRPGSVIVRWVAAGIFEAKRRFRRIRGDRDLKTLFAAIGRHAAGKTLDLEKRVA